MRLLTAALVVLAVGTAARAQQAPSREGFVSVLTTVLDRQGRMVPNLQRQDFTLLDNGKPAEIRRGADESA